MQSDILGMPLRHRTAAVCTHHHRIYCSRDGDQPHVHQVPAGQFVQLLAPARLYLPTGQIFAAALAEVDPIGHA